MHKTPKSFVLRMKDIFA